MILKNKKRTLNKVLFPDICDKVADKLGEKPADVRKIISHFFYLYHNFTQNVFMPRIRIPIFGKMIPRYNKFRRTTIKSASWAYQSKNYKNFINNVFVLKRLQLEGEKKTHPIQSYKHFSRRFLKLLNLIRKHGDS